MKSDVIAVFALPLRIGAITIDMLVLYCDRPGTLTMEALAHDLVTGPGAPRLGLDYAFSHELALREVVSAFISGRLRSAAGS